MIIALKTPALTGSHRILVELTDDSDALKVSNVAIVRDSVTGGVTPQCFNALVVAAYARNVSMEGAQARISGRCNRFATVWSRECPDGVEFAWETVANIVNAGTEFEC